MTEAPQWFLELEGNFCEPGLPGRHVYKLGCEVCLCGSMSVAGEGDSSATKK